MIFKQFSLSTTAAVVGNVSSDSIVHSILLGYSFVPGLFVPFHHFWPRMPLCGMIKLPPCYTTSTNIFE